MSALELDNPLGQRAEIIKLIAKEAHIKENLLQADATLQDLNIDSLDMSMVLMAIEERFDVYISVDTELQKLVTLNDLIGLLESKISEGGESSDAANISN